MRNSTIRVELPLLKFPRGGLVLWISSDGDDWMGAEIKTQKIPRASNKPFPTPPKKPWTNNYTPENPIANI